MTDAAPAGGLSLSVSLAGWPADAVLEITLPAADSSLSLAQVLAQLFPEDGNELSALVELLDVAENPDLPDIFDSFLPIFDQHRLGLCDLKVTAGSGKPAELSDRVAVHLQPGPFGIPRLELSVEPEYRPLQYAVSQGYWPDVSSLLEWAASHTLLYFLDKHEYRLPLVSTLADRQTGDTLAPLVEILGREGWLSFSADTGLYRITGEGRAYIGRLLTETEGYIDRFDHFKDTLWDEDSAAAEFDTGLGDDLRVAAFIAEGLEPARVLLLLRLYDGTLDQFAESWPELIGDVAFFDWLLEPVVNRDLIEEELLPLALEDGYAYREGQVEREREERSQSWIARRVRAAGEPPEPGLG